MVRIAGRRMRDIELGLGLVADDLHLCGEMIKQVLALLKGSSKTASATTDTIAKRS
jgi:hypothetical protein